MKPSLNTQLKTQLSLTPQMQQFMALLQMSGMELEAEVAHMLDTNPFLELQLLSEAPTEEAEPIAQTSDSSQGLGVTWEHASPVTLQAHLYAQAGTLRLSPGAHAALHSLIESLNQDGYLQESLESLAQDQDIDRQEWQTALTALHSLEPVGVGARDLAHCIQLQLQTLPPTPARDLALCICAQPLTCLARHDTRQLMRTCDASRQAVEEAIALIQHLEPKPGRPFAQVEQYAVVPDVLVYKTEAGFDVRLNPQRMPALRVQAQYESSALEHPTPGLQQCLSEARWFVKALGQRSQTLLRVSRAIVAQQSSFLSHGPSAMRPLLMQQIAQTLALHESTISRATHGKYMATPHGTVELKYFFSSSVSTDAGGNASSTAVCALIAQLIAKEDPQHPLSDQALVAQLQAQGILCARRTVAKYRESLKIAPTHLRKKRT